MPSIELPRALRSLLGACLVALALVGCHQSSAAPDDLGVSAASDKMPSSAAAAAVVERARRIHAAPLPEPLNLPQRRRAAGPRAVIAASSAEAHIRGASIHADLGAGRAVTAEVAHPLRAHQPRALALPSGAALSLAIRDTADVSAEYANGYIVYRGAMLAGGDLIVGPSENGFEDYFFFDQRPDHRRIEYDLTLPPAVAGLRLSSNILELVGRDGAPLLHASSPFLVDSAGKVTNAKLSVAGCAFDDSTQPTWRRRPTAPGASHCRISVTWDDGNVQYPAVLDPAWESATAMPVATPFYNRVILAGRAPQQIVAFGFENGGALQNTTLFFDVDSGTWSVGPPTVVARSGSSAVSFNNSKTNDGAQLFVSGGVSVGAGGQRITESSTELLSLNASGQWAWKLASPMHAARFGHTATAIPTATGSHVLLAGGYGDGPKASGCDTGPSGTTAELYDTATGSFVTPAPPNLPAPVGLATAALAPDGQTVVILSGYNGGVDQPLHYCSGSSLVLAFRGGQWLTLPGLPSNRIDPEVAALNDGRFLVTGGVGYTDATQQTCVAKTQTEIFTFSPVPPYGSWATADPVPIAGAGSLVTLANGAVMYGAMGADASCDQPPTPTAEVDLFDPRTGHWSRTTDTAVPHRGGGLASVTKSTGEQEAVVFGGATAFTPPVSWTYTGATETFKLAPTGGACTVGPECVTGICLGSMCQPPGLPITIDATALSNKGLSIPGVLDGRVLDTTQPRPLNLAAGSYTLQVLAGVPSSVAFVVKPDGTLDYDASLEGVLAGRGTTTLKVNGRTITIQTRLTQTQLALVAYHFNQGSETDALPFSAQTPSSFTLLPVPSPGYSLTVDGGHVSALQLSLDLAGKIHIPPSELAFARGEGTTTLLITGQHVSVTMPAGLGDGSIAGITLPAGKTTDVFLLPYAGGSPFTFQIAGHSGPLTVDAAGDVLGDIELVHALQIHGDGAPYCSADGADAQANGWNLTPLSCSGISQQKSTGYIDAPTPSPTLTARLGGAGRPPNQLPRDRKPAGGDPVLGDGELLIDRVDASLAGAGIHYEFRRSYRSGLENDGPLSPGWEHSYDQRIIGQALGDPQSPRFDPTTVGDDIGTNCDGTVQYQDGEGNLQLFRFSHWESGPGNSAIQYFTGQNGDLQLEFDWVPFGGSFWRIRRADGMIIIFDRAGFLASINDPAGNSLSFVWDRATAPPPPRSDCAAGGYDAPGCAAWLFSLTNSPIGQRRRLARVSDARRTIYYVYSQTNTQNIYPNDRLQCISLQNDCAGNVLASFGYDVGGTSGRLTSVTHGAVGAAAFETYAYHPRVSDAPYCLASADLPNYCHRLCDPKTPPYSCENLDYQVEAQARCQYVYCPVDQTTCSDLPDPTLIRKGKKSICCTSKPIDQPDPVCTSFLWGGPTCVDGCESTYQCQKQVDKNYAYYAGGVPHELDNDITDVFDNRGNLVVHNDYGEDQSTVSFDKVVKQQLASSSSDNTITFDYHDLVIEAMSNGPPVYTSGNGATPWNRAYSTPDATVQKFVLSPDTVIDLCPRVCPDGAGTCGVYDYGAATQNIGVEFNPAAMTSAVVIHDLHGLTRIQYLDQTFMVRREVTVQTNEISDYTYSAGLLSGARAASGVRSCIEHDARGRVTQSSLVPAAGYGSTVTQATTFAYGPSGQLSDVGRDVFGALVKTHYERDAFARVVEMDEDVRQGAPPLRTLFSYDGETPPAGVLETPTQVTYPNGRVDKFSQFHPSMGGPQSIVIDAKSATPERRFVHYDSFGRVTDEGEVNRYAQRYAYGDAADLWRLTSVGHSLDGTSWIDVPVQSHVVNGETVVDSVREATRVTSFTTVGRFPTQKDLTATAAPQGTTLPATQTSCFNYSPDGRLEATVLPEGNGVSYSYSYRTDATTVMMKRGFGIDTSGAWAAGCRGHAAPQNDPGTGPAYGRVYKPGGFLSGEIDENQTGRLFTTDGFGRVIQIASIPNGVRQEDPVAVQQFGYDVAGHRIWEALRAPGAAYGRPTLPDATVLAYVEYDYDLAGRVVAQRTHVVETNEVLTKTIAYDDVAATVTTNDRGAVTTTAYDGRGRVSTTKLPDTSITSVVHGLGVDTATVQSNSNGNIVRAFHYDTRGLLLNVQTAVGAVLYQGSYDDDGNQLTETRAGMGPVTWSYDSFGRLVTETKTISTKPTPVLATSTYQYDRNDRVTAYFDAENSSAGGKPWTMTFTGTDAPLSVVDPLTRAGSYVYSKDPKWSNTLLATMTEPNGRVTSFRYDSQARLIDVYHGACLTTGFPWECGVPLATQRHMTYDARNQVVQVEAPGRAAVAMTYDSLGRIVEDKVGVGESIVHHTYLDQGRTQTTQVWYGASLATMTHRYDDLGRLHAVDYVAPSGQPQTLATYDFGIGAGGPLSLAYANGATAAYSYDDKLRQTGIDVTFKAPGTTTPPAAVASLHEAFGADSIPRMRQHRFGARPPLTDVFQVDEDGRITGENLLLPGITLPPGEIDNGAVGSHMHEGAAWRAYDLDKIGNIKQRRMKASTLVHEVDKLSRLTRLGATPIKIDPTDNLQGPQGGPVQFTFDDFTGTVLTASNGAATSSFSYDALDRRRGEHRSADHSDHVYVWDGNQLVAHGSAGNLTLDVPGDDLDAHLVSIDQLGAGAQWFYHQGPDQSVLAVTGSAGLIEGYTYSAFGELSIWNPSGAPTNKSAFGNLFQFQGHVFDAATSTYSMRARQYSPTWGSFISPDPLSAAAGPSLFAFTGSRPLQNRDPLGLLADSWNKPRLWMTEWMNTWSQDPGAAGQQFLFAPESQVQHDLEQELLGKLNAYAGAGISYYLRSGELHRSVDGVENVKSTNLGSGISEYGSTPFHIDSVVGTVTVGGRLCPTDRVFAERQGFLPRAADWIVDHPYKAGGLIFGGVFVSGVTGGVIYGLATGTLTVGAGTAGVVGTVAPAAPLVAKALPSPQQAMEMVRRATAVGSALKSDAAHRSASFVVDQIAEKGSVFATTGYDGVTRILIQIPGALNGVVGRFEWIVEGNSLTHQFFTAGGTINGIPIKP